MIRCVSFILVAILILATSCEKPKSASPPAETASQQTFQVHGVVLEVKPSEKTVRIRHQEIPGYMPAMTMPFEVKNTNELAGLQPGDSVAFRMIVTEKDGWIDQIQKVSSGGTTNSIPTNTPAAPGVRVARDVDPLNAGDALPEYHFTNQLG